MSATPTSAPAAATNARRPRPRADRFVEYRLVAEGAQHPETVLADPYAPGFLPPPRRRATAHVRTAMN